MKRFSARLAALEALERAQQPGAAYVCLHAVDYAALSTAPAELRQAIAEDYQLSGQKLYVGVCLCEPTIESCRVCRDDPMTERKV